MKKNKLPLVCAGFIALAGCGREMRVERFENESYFFRGEELRKVEVDGNLVCRCPDDRNEVIDFVSYMCPYSMLVTGVADLIRKEFIPPASDYSVQLDWEERYKELKKQRE